MINFKAKEHILKSFLELVEFDRLKVERWQVPGINFKINQTIVPTFSVNLTSIQN